MKKLLLIGLMALFWCSGMKASALSDTSGHAKYLGFKVHQGFVIIHSRHLRPVKNSYPRGLEFHLAWHNTTKKAWESCHCYPRLGLITTFWDYDNPEILGYGATTMFFVEPIFGAEKRVSFAVRASFGLSFQTKPYDEISNPNNYSYSTYMAFSLQLGTLIHVRLKPKWYLDITTVYNHFSNGGIREPNKGINWPTAALGIGRYLDRPNFYNREKRSWRENKSPDSRVDATFFLAFKEPESKLYLFSPGLEVKFSRQISRLTALTIGVEWMYDNGTRYKIARAGRAEDCQMGSMALGHEFLLGKLLFSQQFGFYLYKPYRVGHDVYQRYGLMFRVSKHLSFGVNMKSHGHVADFLDFRVGVTY